MILHCKDSSHLDGTRNWSVLTSSILCSSGPAQKLAARLSCSAELVPCALFCSAEHLSVRGGRVTFAVCGAAAETVYS